MTRGFSNSWAATRKQAEHSKRVAQVKHPSDLLLKARAFAIRHCSHMPQIPLSHVHVLHVRTEEICTSADNLSFEVPSMNPATFTGAEDANY